MNKIYVILRMYDDLLADHAIKINECCKTYDISVSTFRRYIACLRNYLAEQRSEEIIYLPEHSEYVLEKKKGNSRKNFFWKPKKIFRHSQILLHLFAIIKSAEISHRAWISESRE